MTYSILITCEKCGSKDINFYRQKRADGVFVVTARCVNMHIPNKYKIFYPVGQFEIDKLPELPKEKQAIQINML